MPRVDDSPITIEELRLYWTTHQQALFKLPADVRQRITQQIERGAIAPAAAIFEESKKIQRDVRLTDVGRRDALARLVERNRGPVNELRAAANKATEYAEERKQAALRELVPLPGGGYAFRDELEAKDVASVLRRELRYREIRDLARRRSDVELAGDYLAAVSDPSSATREFVRALEEAPFVGAGQALLPAATLEAGQAARLRQSPMAPAIEAAEREASLLSTFANLAERALRTFAESSADTMGQYPPAGEP
jgi:hypothetical protein